MTPTTLSIPLILEEFTGIPRQAEPVTVGLPFPQGAVSQLAELALFDAHGQPVPCQAHALAQWADHSVKWGLFDFQATLPANAVTQYAIQTAPPETPPAEPGIVVSVETLRRGVSTESMTVDTGAAVFVLNAKVFKPFERVLVAGEDLLATSAVTVSDEAGRSYQHEIDRLTVETAGTLRTTINVAGRIRATDGAEFANFFARLHFYAQRSYCKIDYTIHNPKAAQHPGGLWDLGDPNAIYFNDLAFHVTLAAANTPTIQWTAQLDQSTPRVATGRINIYQDSSGGEQWQSTNHVNRFNKVMHSFRGYRVQREHEVLEEGFRATPVLSLIEQQHCLSGTVYRFWENFPKALEARDNTLMIRLFPQYYHDVFELQGGEQKTHTFYLQFQRLADAASQPDDLRWIQQPIIAHATPAWYAQSGAFNYLVPANEDPYPETVALINTAVAGEQSFTKRRELIDEYGWRNFGEMYADHEKVYYKGNGLPISHYNNQYDCIYAQILQFVRSGNVRWLPQFHDLARHVIDIDIYHTKQDKAAYNGGLFWHTFHYLDAATATHRSYSKKTMELEGFHVYGGGHANEHNYATGLLYHYYLTGETASKEAAVGLAEWVINMDDGTQTKYRRLNTRPTGAASMSAEPEYHGPGRGAGYSIYTLLDAYQLTHAARYLDKAEELIRRCVHPHDDIATRDLLNLEMRWSYTIFFQALGRYLDFKVEAGAFDKMFCYARASLLHYAKWMCAHERRSVTEFAHVNYPTETWPAQDLRKGNVLFLAAKYAPDSFRAECLAKARALFEEPLADFMAFETKNLTRPLILLMTNTQVPAYFAQHPDERAPVVECAEDFGEPQRFRRQLYELQIVRDTVQKIVGALRKIVGAHWKEPIK